MADLEQGSPTFAMLCCAFGAELAVKESMIADGWRLAFSRPGFVTGKHDAAPEPPTGTFIRTSSRSIGQCRSENGQEQIKSLIELLKSSPLASRPFDQIHVWPKDRAPIGRFDFEPGPDEVTKLVADEVFAAIKGNHLRCDSPNRIAEADERVLDVVLVEPSHWFIGTHTATTWPTRWPGAVQPISPAYEPVSRAYYKAAEAITWSGFDLQAGDLAVEIGSAPGGACGRLLELGLRVLGVDPAEMDPRIAEHPKYQHYKARAGDLPRRVFRGAKWLLVDSNVTPDKTLVTVGNLVTHQQTSFQGLLLTMKLGDYTHADRIPKWERTIRGWGAKNIQVRQLARNRCEVCFAVTM
ncbi:putative 23S rRNA ribose 2'-O-ribose methyltransferase [Rubripirellula amarantea]|uniref:Putative 23S rRNA ribose 2'-O-ribose methyltransferase n=1 Tax=Rubripirellula amarantea TaxID=2527999 RepID=A0A5C5WRB9_9BACT|nr:SAM-dependent methyltransferase [Rubripirellula amarantea]TWT52795.1 putative 23S rRNA ribose 2'-O-ribose methyltransferase [Rubripirellula amarantea]